MAKFNIGVVRIIFNVTKVYIQWPPGVFTDTNTSLDKKGIENTTYYEVSHSHGVKDLHVVTGCLKDNQISLYQHTTFSLLGEQMIQLLRICVI